MLTEFAVLPNRYFDSVFLMRVAKRLTGEPGIAQAAVVMGTPKNLQVLADAGYSGTDALGASSNDLVVSLQADSRERALAVLDSIDGWLQRDSGRAGASAVRTLDQALELQPGSNLAVISVPGEYAAREARQVLERGLNVFLFSDNVPIDEERSLKEYAHSKGLLVMGPDCGTAIIGGAGIGFANSVRRGPIGVIGASGTGIQEVTTLVHRWGSGISHAIGTGSRDFSDAIGGISALQAIDALDTDPATAVIVLVSKPPGSKTLSRISQRIAVCSKPVVTCYLGVSEDGLDESVTVTHDLDSAAAAAVRLAGGNVVEDGTPDASLAERERALLGSGRKLVRGIFAGGTFCYQAQQVMRDARLLVLSNEPLQKDMQLPDSQRSSGHTLVDMGADEFTRGRPHPMIDSSLRAQRIVAEAQDPEVGVLLIDCILGYGASLDPAGELAPAVRQAKELAEQRGGHLTVVASISGTSEDPQGLVAQSKLLEEAGALVFSSSFRAAEFATALVNGGNGERGTRS